jgi:hypothetical protein
MVTTKVARILHGLAQVGIVWHAIGGIQLKFVQDSATPDLAMYIPIHSGTFVRKLSW